MAKVAPVTSKGIAPKSRRTHANGSKSTAYTIHHLAAGHPAGVSKRSQTKLHKRKMDINDHPQQEADAAISKSDKPFPFLSLPPELRNNVYAKVFDDLPEIYLTTRSRNLASRSALPRVSRQIHNEFVPVMYLCACEVVAKVSNLNFGHVITFLNTLSEMEMKALIESPNSTCHLRIELEIQGSKGRMSSYFELGTLYRWLNRLEHPTKKGTKINASYVITDVNGGIHDLRNRIMGHTIRAEQKKSLKDLSKIWEATSFWLSAHVEE